VQAIRKELSNLAGAIDVCKTKATDEKHDWLAEITRNRELELPKVQGDISFLLDRSIQIHQIVSVSRMTVD